MNRTSSNIFAAILIGLPLAMLLFFQVSMANTMWLLMRGSPLFMTVLSVSIVLLWLITKSAASEPAVVFVVGFMAVVVLIGTLVATSYQRSLNVSEAVEIVEPTSSVAGLPKYEQRAPLIVASRQTKDNVTINGDAKETRYVPSEDMFGAVVVRSGVLKGYGQVVWQKIDETGQAKVESCEFSGAAKRRINGWFHTNLGRAIYRESFGVQFRRSDMFSYCDDGIPMVVIPLIKYGPGIFPAEVPAGVAVYNGKTGDVKVHKNVKTGDFPGQVYPMSLAEKAKEATRAQGGWWSWITREVGFEEYGTGDGNSSNFNLKQLGSENHSFVTPLVMIGGGKAITAVGEVRSNKVSYGELNPYTIYLLPKARQGDSAVEARVKSDFADLEWATGMELFEIVPTGPTQWAATLGQKKSVMYRLLINSDGSSCLFNVKGVKLRCTNDEVSKENKVEVPKKGDLSKLSNKELKELTGAVVDELNRRVEEG